MSDKNFKVGQQVRVNPENADVYIAPIAAKVKDGRVGEIVGVFPNARVSVLYPKLGRKHEFTLHRTSSRWIEAVIPQGAPDA
jgi:hypothetical protein